MKKIILSIIAVVSILSMKAQSIERSVVAASGNTISNSSVSLDFTIGQPVATTISNGSTTLTQGFQQGGRVSSVPLITLTVSSDGVTVDTSISYRETATIGLDPGFDIGNFDGAVLDIYTRLVDGSSNVNVTYQSLPNTGYETMVIPVGLTAASGKTVTFAAVSTLLPDGLSVYLEDQLLNKYVKLDATSTYEITLSSSENGVGRFNLYTTFNQNVWNGSVNSNWAVAGNWSENGSSTITNDVVIQNTGTNPVIDAASIAEMNSLSITNMASLAIGENGAAIIENDFDANGTVTITSGATSSGVFIVKGTANGQVIYERGGLLANKWSAVTSPVSGQSIKSFIENPDNNIRVNPTVTPNRYAVAYFDDSQPSASKWVYYTEDDITTDALTFEQGKSYIMSRGTDGSVTFTGDVETQSVNIHVDASLWNAVGNPYTAFMPINGNVNANFIMDNINVLDPFNIAVYVWDASESKYKQNSLLSLEELLAPGQGFFVKTASDASAISFNEAYRSTQPNSGGIFARSSNENQIIKVAVASGDIKVLTDIAFRDDASLGLDPGLDIGNFDADQLDVFTKLLDESSDNNITYQSVPSSKLENVSIPLGVKANAGDELVFSVTSLNLPEGVKIYIEDIKKGVYQIIDESNTYKVQLSEAINGTGRFHIHTSGKSLSAETVFDETVIKIYNVQSELVVEGVYDTFEVTVFNTTGAKLFSGNYLGEGVNSIQLSDLPTAVYIVRIDTVLGSKDKKIIINKN